MKRVQDQPITRTLTLVILFTCSIVLLFACAVLAAYELFDFRRALVRDISVLSDVLGKNTQAALAFEDEAAAREVLQALQVEPYIVAACLYAKDGRPFAEYTRSGSSPHIPSGPDDGHRFERGHLVLFRPVMLNEKRVGTIYLQAELQGVYARLRLFAGIAGLVLVASFMVAIVLSSRLQRLISQPILVLTDTARAISKRKDYSVRAEPQGKNEIGVLTDAFNQMLVGIEQRESALRGANDALENENAERKRAEGRVHDQLSRLDLLHRITRAISERQDLPSIFQVIVRSLAEDLPVDYAAICTYDSASDSLRVASVGVGLGASPLEPDASTGTTISVESNGLARCLGGLLAYEPDIRRQAASPFLQRLARGGLGSMVAAPLLVEAKAFGLLIAARQQAHAFNSGDCGFLKQLSEQVALAAHQAQLYTTLQQAYEELRQTQQTVMQQERLKAVGQMASGIAHDINNALSPVALYTESLLERETGLSERAREYLVTIQRAVEDVAQTVTRMREFSRPREPQLQLEPIDLNSMVQQVLVLTRARWSDLPQKRGVVITLQEELQADLLSVMGAQSEIRDALTNLVFNAIDAMPEGGTLTLRTRAVPVYRRSSSDEPAPSVFVEVCDTGVGMDEETKLHSLEPFFTTKGERGTGLGLAMVYGMAQRHSGHIEIESKPGEGTTVRLIFLASAPSANSSPVSSAGPLPDRCLKILIVDDDPMLIKTLRDILAADGHSVTPAEGGQAGIDAFEAALKRGESFAAVITDLGMPHVDGRKVAAAVKAVSQTPVIMLTGWGQRLAAEDDIPPHVDRLLSKPPRLLDLRTAIDELTKGDRRQVALEAGRQT